MTTLGRQNEIAPDAADRVAQVKSLLVTTGADRDVVRAAIHALSDDELMPFGLGAFRMNIMSLFSDDWSRQHVLQVARDATISYMWTGWEYHNHYLPKLAACRTYPRSSAKIVHPRARPMACADFD